MIRLLVLFFIVLSLAMLPVYAFDRQVMPQLMGLKETYGNAENMAARAAGAESQSSGASPDKLAR